MGGIPLIQLGRSIFRVGTRHCPLAALMQTQPCAGRKGVGPCRVVAALFVSPCARPEFESTAATLVLRNQRTSFLRAALTENTDVGVRSLFLFLIICNQSIHLPSLASFFASATPPVSLSPPSSAGRLTFATTQSLLHNHVSFRFCLLDVHTSLTRSDTPTYILVIVSPLPRPSLLTTIFPYLPRRPTPPFQCMIYIPLLLAHLARFSTPISRTLRT